MLLVFLSQFGTKICCRIIETLTKGESKLCWWLKWAFDSTKRILDTKCLLLYFGRILSCLNYLNHISLQPSVLIVFGEWKVEKKLKRMSKYWTYYPIHSWDFIYMYKKGLLRMQIQVCIQPTTNQNNYEWLQMKALKKCQVVQPLENSSLKTNL